MLFKVACDNVVKKNNLDIGWWFINVSAILPNFIHSWSNTSVHCQVNRSDRWGTECVSTLFPLALNSKWVSQSVTGQHEAYATVAVPSRPVRVSPNEWFWNSFLWLLPCLKLPSDLSRPMTLYVARPLPTFWRHYQLTYPSLTQLLVYFITKFLFIPNFVLPCFSVNSVRCLWGL